MCVASNAPGLAAVQPAKLIPLSAGTKRSGRLTTLGHIKYIGATERRQWEGLTAAPVENLIQGAEEAVLEGCHRIRPCLHSLPSGGCTKLCSGYVPILHGSAPPQRTSIPTQLELFRA